MWQKLKQLDIIDLERARIPLLNAIQLVAAVTRSYGNGTTTNTIPRLLWNPAEAAFYTSLKNGDANIIVSLDIKDLVLSIKENELHAEHLVLSGLTYPLAYGWMRIKLEAFQLDSELFDDHPEYQIERNLKGDEELNLHDHSTNEALAIYYSNTYYMLNKFAEVTGNKGEITINPSNLAMALSSTWQNHKEEIGFIPGDQQYLEPYFYRKLEESALLHEDVIFNVRAIWHGKNWHGWVLLADDILSVEDGREEQRIMELFSTGISPVG